MSKFLEAVENNIPEKDLDKITDAKRALQRFLLSKDINVKVKTFRDDIMIELEDGRMVKLEVRDITDNVEDNEFQSELDRRAEAKDPEAMKAKQNRENAYRKKLQEFEKETTEFEEADPNVV